MIKSIAALALAISLSSWLAENARAEDRALIVGIGTYTNLPPTSGLTESVRDAENFTAFLQDSFGFKSSQIKLLVNADATHQAIVATFRHWLVEGTSPGDRAVLYFSGHGLRLVSDGKWTTALAPADVRGGGIGSMSEFDNVLFSDELTDLRHELDGRRVLFVIDSCYSGKIARDADQPNAQTGDVRRKTLTAEHIGLYRGAVFRTQSPAAALRNAARPGEFALWAAVAPNQIALERKGEGSLFTAAIIAGVRTMTADANRDGKIQVAELLNYVSDASRDYCQKNPLYCSDGLTPDLTAEPDEAYRISVFWPPGMATHSPPFGSGADNSQAVFQHRNDFELTLELDPGTLVPLGTNVFFRVTSGVSGRLLLFDQDPDGAFRQIFPNKYSLEMGASRIVPARATAELPHNQDGFRYTAKRKGKSFAMAVVIADDVGIDEVTRRFEGLESIKEPQKFIGALAARLQAPIIDKRPNVPDRRARWAFSLVPYEVR